MILSTFQHVRGIGPKKEIMLWKAGFTTWDIVLSRQKNHLLEGIISISRIESFIEEIKNDLERLEIGDLFSIASRLDRGEHWRFLDSYLEKSCFLDIETGIDNSDSECITVIGMYNTNEGYRCFIEGKDIESFPQYFSNFPIVVTFNGSGFDIPVLTKQFGINLLMSRQVHVDLMLAGRKIGLRGSLKKIEKQLGISRDADIDGLNGYDAFLLWREWVLYKNYEALERLIRYNMFDTVNLKSLAEYVVRKRKEELETAGI